MPTLRLRKSPKTKKQLSRNGKLARTSKKIKKTKAPHDTELLQLSNELECLAQSYEVDDPGESAIMQLRSNQDAVPQTFSFFITDINPEYIQTIMEKQQPHSDFAGLPRGLLSRVAPVSVSVDIIYVIIQ